MLYGLYSPSPRVSGCISRIAQTYAIIYITCYVSVSSCIARVKKFNLVTQNKSTLTVSVTSMTQ